MKRSICIALLSLVVAAGCDKPAEMPPKTETEGNKYLAPRSESSTAEERNYIVNRIVEYEEYLEKMKTP